MYIVLKSVNELIVQKLYVSTRENRYVEYKILWCKRK